MALLEDELMQKQMGEATSKDITLDWIKRTMIRVKDVLKTENTMYCNLQTQLDTLRTKLNADREVLHQLTCTILGAFDIRILPWLDVGSMVAQKGVRAMSKVNKRKGLLLAHGAFRQKLIHHCGDASIKHRKINWVTEQFTSKLCGNCFRYCGYLGGSRVYKCAHGACGVHMDRDGNAARNIWIWGWLLIDRTEQIPSSKDMAAISNLRYAS